MRENAVVPPLKAKQLFAADYALFIPRKLARGITAENLKTRIADLPFATSAGGNFRRTLDASAAKAKWSLNIAVSCSSFTQAARTVHAGACGAVLPLIAAQDFELLARGEIGRRIGIHRGSAPGEGTIHIGNPTVRSQRVASPAVGYGTERHGARGNVNSAAGLQGRPFPITTFPPDAPSAVSAFTFMVPPLIVVPPSKVFAPVRVGVVPLLFIVTVLPLPAMTPPKLLPALLV